jgi:hypothetical protein
MGQGGKAARRQVALLGLAVLAVLPPCRLVAQTPDSLNVPHIPAVVHFGKWAALGGAVGLGVLSVQRHNDANTRYDALRSRCFDFPTGCEMVGGHYADPVDEALYQDTRRLDHQAARYLIGTEALFSASMAGFIWELMHRHGAPRNIPFSPRVEAGMRAAQVGLNLRF